MGKEGEGTRTRVLCLYQLQLNSYPVQHLAGKSSCSLQGTSPAAPQSFAKQVVALFLCDIFGIDCEERPLPCVCKKEKKKDRERKTQRHWHRETHTEERKGRGRGFSGESLRPTARESRGVAGGESLHSEDQISGSGAGTNGHLSLLRAGPDNKMHFHGGAAAAVRGTLRAMKTPHSAPVESERFWSSCCS